MTILKGKPDVPTNTPVSAQLTYTVPYQRLDRLGIGTHEVRYDWTDNRWENLDGTPFDLVAARYNQNDPAPTGKIRLLFMTGSGAATKAGVVNVVPVESAAGELDITVPLSGVPFVSGPTTQAIIANLTGLNTSVQTGLASLNMGLASIPAGLDDIAASKAALEFAAGTTPLANEAALTGKTAGAYRLIASNEQVMWSGTTITARSPIAATASDLAGVQKASRPGLNARMFLTTGLDAKNGLDEMLNIEATRPNNTRADIDLNGMSVTLGSTVILPSALKQVTLMGGTIDLTGTSSSSYGLLEVPAGMERLVLDGMVWTNSGGVGRTNGAIYNRAPVVELHSSRFEGFAVGSSGLLKLIPAAPVELLYAYKNRFIDCPTGFVAGSAVGIRQATLIANRMINHLALGVVTAATSTTVTVATWTDSRITEHLIPFTVGMFVRLQNQNPDIDYGEITLTGVTNNGDGTYTLAHAGTLNTSAIPTGSEAIQRHKQNAGDSQGDFFQSNDTNSTDFYGKVTSFGNFLFNVRMGLEVQKKSAAFTSTADTIFFRRFGMTCGEGGQAHVTEGTFIGLGRAEGGGVGVELTANSNSTLTDSYIGGGTLCGALLLSSGTTLPVDSVGIDNVTFDSSRNGGQDIAVHHTGTIPGAKTTKVTVRGSKFIGAGGLNRSIIEGLSAQVNEDVDFSGNMIDRTSARAIIRNPGARWRITNSGKAKVGAFGEAPIVFTGLDIAVETFVNEGNHFDFPLNTPMYKTTSGRTQITTAELLICTRRNLSTRTMLLHDSGTWTTALSGSNGSALRWLTGENDKITDSNATGGGGPAVTLTNGLTDGAGVYLRDYEVAQRQAALLGLTPSTAQLNQALDAVIHTNGVLDGRKAATFTRALSANLLSGAAVGVDVPRLTGTDTSAPAILIETALTGRLLYSRDFSNTYWTKSANMTVTADQAIGPDDTAYLDLLTDTGTGGSVSRASVTGFTAGTYQAIWSTLKRGTAPTTRLALDIGAGNSANITYTWATGAIANSTPGTVGVRPAISRAVALPQRNGCIRLVMVLLMGTGGTSGTVSLSLPAGGTVYAGDIQAEASAFPTSPVQSGAAAGTRPADSYRLDPLATNIGTVGQAFSLSLAFWHPGSAGTLIGFNTGGTAQPNRRLNLSIATDGNVSLLAQPSSGASVTISTTTAPTSRTWHTAMLEYSGTALSLYVDGVQMGTSTAFTMEGPYSALQIGGTPTLTGSELTALIAPGAPVLSIPLVGTSARTASLVAALHTAWLAELNRQTVIW